MKKLLEPGETIVKFDGKTKIILGLLAVLALPQLWETVDNFQDNYLTSKEKKLEREHRENLEKLREKKILDSILNIERIRFNEQASRDAERIRDNLGYLQRILHNINNITVFNEHDGGDPVATGSFKYMSVLYSRSNVIVTDIRRDFHKKPIGNWPAFFMAKAKENGYIYFANLDNEQELQTDITSKEYTEFIGSKSFLVMKIKSTGKGTYFLGVSFDTINPHLKNKFLKLKIENVNTRLKELIYEVPEHLKYSS
jgi:hypothetical protein